MHYKYSKTQDAKKLYVHFFVRFGPEKSYTMTLPPPPPVNPTTRYYNPINLRPATPEQQTCGIVQTSGLSFPEDILVHLQEMTFN